MCKQLTFQFISGPSLHPTASTISLPLQPPQLVLTSPRTFQTSSSYPAHAGSGSKAGLPEKENDNCLRGRGGNNACADGRYVESLCLVEECCELEECFSCTFEILGGAEDVCMQEVRTTTCTDRTMPHVLLY